MGFCLHCEIRVTEEVPGGFIDAHFIYFELLIRSNGKARDNNSALLEARMPRTRNCGHGHDFPCTCAMGNLSRFVEPVVLLLLKKKGRSYGYDLGNDLHAHALTDAVIERAALYRTLRTLEANGNVVSEWETDQGGPARRVYKLTRQGENHLQEWAAVLYHVAKSMRRFVKVTRSLGSQRPAARRKSAVKVPQ